MIEEYKDLLYQSYERYKQTGKCYMRALFTSTEEKQNFLAAYNYLESCGYVRTLVPSSGFYEYEITPYGIAFVEDDDY